MGASIKVLEKIDRQLQEAHELKKTIAAQTAFLRDAKKQLANIEVELEAFANDNREEIGEGLLLRHGRLGFRRAGKAALVLLKGWTESRVIETLRRLNLSDYIRVKEEVNKEKLKSDFTVPSELKQLGYALDDSPTFFYETFE